MTTRFITYVPKPTKAIDRSKPLRKNTPKEISTSDNNQLSTRNPLPVKVPAIERNFLIQKANRNDGTMVQESLTKFCKGSNNGDKDEDDTYFLTVQELIAGRGVNGGCAPKAVDKPALESTSSPNLGNVQDIPTLVRGNEQNDTSSEADLSDFHLESTRFTTGRSESRQTSLDTTISSSSKPQNFEVDCKVSRAAELCERDSDSNDSDSDSDNCSETESKFGSWPAQKKQKTDNSQQSRRERSISGVQTAQTLPDELQATGDSESQYIKGCQDPFDDQDLYDVATKSFATVCSDELKHNNAMHSRPKEYTNIISASRHATTAGVCQESVTAIDGQSATLSSPSAIPAPDDPKITEQVIEVANDNRVWEICDIIGKEDVDGVPHYWVQWSVTLVPKYEMGKARALIARFEAGLRAQRKQKDGKVQGRLPPLKPGERAIAGVCSKGETQKKRGRGRPRKQLQG